MSENRIVEKAPAPFHYKMMHFQRNPWYKQGDAYYYAGDYPQDELYRLDESLLESEGKEIMENMLDDDNPIMICYKLK